MNRKEKAYTLFRVVTLSPVWMTLSVILALLSIIGFFVPYYIIYTVVKHLFSSLPMDTLWYIRWGSAALFGAATNVIFYFSSLSASHAGAFNIGIKLRKRMLNHLSRIPLGEQMTRGSGRMQTLIYDDINEIQSYFAHELPEMIIAAMTPIVLMVFMLYINPWYSLALCVGMAIAYYFNAKSYSYASGGGKKMMEIYLTALENLSNECNEFVRGIRVIRIFGQGNTACKKLDKSIKDYSENCISYTLIWEKFRCYFESLMNNLYLFLLPVAAIILLRSGHMQNTVSDLIIFIVLTPALAHSAPKMEEITNGAVRVQTLISRLNELLAIAEMPEVTEDTHKIKSKSIEFRNVSFSYDGQKNALSNINFTAPEGKITAIVGESGSGKSTIAYTLARFWDVIEGSIRIGDVDIQNLKTATLMEHIAFVFQDPVIFKERVYENIRGNTQADMQTVVKAAQKAMCHDFIIELDDGYDTVLGGDVKLSGGQLQRIAIARAILKDSPILVLDEPTASTDIENEYKLQQAIGELARNKTVIMIAHRLSTIRNADQILVMDKGTIVEKGRHDELLQKGGLYHRLWNIGQENIIWKLR